MPRKKSVSNEASDFIDVMIPTRIRFKAKNLAQKEYARLITERELVICSGPAGTGKSYTSIARGVELLQNKTNKFNKLVICTPAVEAEEKLGHLPGTLEEKMAPFLASSVAIIDKILTKQTREKLVEQGIIEFEALGFIRGKTIDNSIFILEEAQNMSPNQMKTLLTRIGENTKFIISGDLEQSDKFKSGKQSGLYDALNRLKSIDEIGFFEFSSDDIVRNPIISKILKLYNQEEEKPKKNKELLIERKELRQIPEVPKEERVKLDEGVEEKPEKTFFSKWFKW
jgi:phosphate starvation-inducible PhoH-like protein